MVSAQGLVTTQLGVINGATTPAVVVGKTATVATEKGNVGTARAAVDTKRTALDKATENESLKTTAFNDATTAKQAKIDKKGAATNASDYLAGETSVVTKYNGLEIAEDAKLVEATVGVAA